MHPNETRNLDFLAGASVEDLVALLQGALIDPHVGQLAEPALLQLERKNNQGASAVGVS